MCDSMAPFFLGATFDCIKNLVKETLNVLPPIFDLIKGIFLISRNEMCGCNNFKE